MINKTKFLDVNTFNPFLAPKSSDSLQTASTSRINFKVNKQCLKEYTKNTMKISLPKKSAPKKQIGFSSLTNPNQRQYLNSPCSYYASSHEYKSPRSVQSSLQYSHFNTSSLLPGFFLEEREASINCKEDIHDKIIEIGENVHESVIKDVKSNLETIYKQRESEFMKKIEKEKEMNAENERANFMTKLDEIKDQLKAEYEFKLKEKMSEIQMNCQNSALENLEIHKNEVRRECEDKIFEIKEQYQNERRLLAEKAARKERDKIRQQIDEERRANERKITELNNEWQMKMQKNSEELAKQLRLEFDLELNLKIDELNKIKQNELEEQKKFFDFKIKNLNEEINDKQDEIKNLYSRLKVLNEKNYEIVAEFDKIKNEFKNCIKRFTGLNPIESEFLFTFNQFNSFADY